MIYANYVASLNVDPELCEYDLDGEDEVWLASECATSMEIDALAFETVMDRLEKASQRQVSVWCSRLGDRWLI